MVIINGLKYERRPRKFDIFQMATGDHGVAFLAAALLVVEDFKSGLFIYISGHNI